MTTLKLSVLKTHMTDGQWVHAGETLEVAEPRANELVRNGLAAHKAAPTPANKMAPEPANKAQDETAHAAKLAKAAAPGAEDDTAKAAKLAKAAAK